MPNATETHSRHSLADIVLSGAHRHPERIAIRTADDFVSYGLLRDLIINYALHLRARGVSRTSLIAIDSDHPIIAAIVPLACSLLGCGWVYFMGTAKASSALGITHSVHDGTRYQIERKGILLITQDWSSPPIGIRPGERPSFPGYASPDRPWMIAQSSGTTGTPKFMALSETLMWPRITAAAPVDIGPHPACTTLFHPLSNPGIKLILRTFALGGTYVHGRNLDFLRLHNVKVINGAPNHHVAVLPGTPWRGPRFKLGICGGGAMRLPLLARLLEVFECIMLSYASTEADRICTHTISSLDGLSDPLSPGGVVPDASLQIVDESGKSQPPNQEGIVRVRSSSLVDGYIGAPADSPVVFRDGWFFPGDTGYLSETGDLYVTGRVADQLNIGGIKINAEMVDNAMRAIRGVREAACFAHPTRNGVDILAAAIVLTNSSDVQSVLTRLRTTLTQQIAEFRVPTLFYAVDKLPLNQNGKILRHTLYDTIRNQRPIS